jgi:hypothetical protein
MEQLISFARAHNFKLTNLEEQVIQIERRVSDADLDLNYLMNTLVIGGKRRSNKKKHSKKQLKKSSKKRRVSSKNKKRVNRK